MTFVLEKINADTLLEQLQKWNSVFSKKRKMNKIENNAISIFNQIVESLNERHGYLWIAKRDEQLCAVLIGDDSKKGLIIRYLLSNVFDVQAKGAGAFLVREMQSFADKKNLSIRTTSQNADAFWARSSFQLDADNPPDFIYKPSQIVLGQFFKPVLQKEKKDEGKHMRKAHYQYS
ncbi:hypothetical protein [Legionella bononiensis]|uniref:N-acetyltransferase domain-containing protein n=1 Tax=Legionella bononiensis TaxID=2793102 RepID=A0ABS1WC24_9GAMM|nr:hypothetical protein [Legionella bononiensis]MBL7479177.1 hypothetical protein [Legionella bononiensis]MBL7526913.1 hypothetical protein [Legionella bononiensis]MBL7563827.1 hypothetical protein [Legionella bononiensis]